MNKGFRVINNELIEKSTKDEDTRKKIKKKLPTDEDAN